jgi:hypothetical protein
VKFIVVRNAGGMKNHGAMGIRHDSSILHIWYTYIYSICHSIYIYIYIHIWLTQIEQPYPLVIWEFAGTSPSVDQRTKFPARASIASRIPSWWDL